MIDVPHVTLENCRVGDKVYCYSRNAWVTVRDKSSGSIGMIYVEFPNGSSESFFFNGKRYPDDANPDLFWSEPVMTADGPPKRKVKRTWYMGVSETLMYTERFWTTCVYSTVEAVTKTVTENEYLGPWRIIPVEVEVDE